MSNECIAPHSINVQATIYPQTDTIHVGDTLKLSASFAPEYSEGKEHVNIAEKEINFNVFIKKIIHSSNSSSFTDENIINAGIENFDFIVRKGTYKITENIESEDGIYREFFYKLNDKFEVEIDLVVRDTGYYFITLASDAHFDYPSKHCERNFEFIYNFEITDKHLLNNSYQGTLDQNSFYAFAVSE